MIDWFVMQLRERPELAFFVTITIGYALGRLRIGSFTLGAVTGVLIAGVLVGQLGVRLPDALKQTFFLLFLFSIGYRTGPQFFRGLKSDGLEQACLAAFFTIFGLALAYIAARLMSYDAGTAAGLIAGAFTNPQRSEPPATRLRTSPRAQTYGLPSPIVFRSHSP